MEFSSRTEIAPATRGTTPVSVVLIVKNCSDNLRQCLSSINRNFLRDGDEIVVLDTGSDDGGATVKVAKEMGARVLERPDLRKDVRPLVEKWLPGFVEKFDSDPQFKSGCILDFAEARQIVTDAAKHDVQFWIDSDDVFEEQTPGTLREIVNTHMPQLDSIFLNYAYTFDKDDGRLTTILKRERIYDRRAFTWKGRCHETCIPRPGRRMKGGGWFQDYAGAIIHRGVRSDHQIGDIRNYVILRNELEMDREAKRSPDTRTIFYLGNACRGLELDQECIELYERVLEKSGSRDDRFAAAYYVATLYLTPRVGRPVDALDWGFRAMRIDPSDPRGPFLVSRAYYLLGRHRDAVNWYKMGRQLPEPTETLHSYDPEHIHSLPHYIAAFAHKELGDEQGVEEALKLLVQRRPNHPDTKKIRDVLSNWKAGRNLLESLKTVVANTQPPDAKIANRRLRETVSTLAVIPDEMEKIGLGRIEGPDPRGEGKDLTIFCAPTAELWGPRNRKTGIGGSEKAVLEMSRRLQKRGFDVSVYAAVPQDQRGLDEFGVLWRHYSEFNEERPRGTVIFWRNPQAALAPFPIQKRIIWCHDVQRPEKWTPEICAAADEVWVLSEYHKTTLGEEALRLLGDKVWVTRNGVDSELIRSTEAGPRKAKQAVFCSSPDRGVLTAIRAFQEAAGSDPDARLHICYGFSKLYLENANVYDYAHMPDTAQEENCYTYMQKVLRAADSDSRIIWRGRIGPQDMIRLMKESGVWLYPTRFPEISCMAAMEAQACGCRIVASDYAALSETILWGYDNVFKATPESAGETLKAAVAWEPGPHDESTQEEALRCFSYETLADEWAARLA